MSYDEITDAKNRLLDYAHDLDCTERPAVGDYDVTADIRLLCGTVDDLLALALDGLPRITKEQGLAMRTGQATRNDE